MERDLANSDMPPEYTVEALSVLLNLSIHLAILNSTQLQAKWPRNCSEIVLGDCMCVCDCVCVCVCLCDLEARESVSRGAFLHDILPVSSQRDIFQ